MTDDERKAYFDLINTPHFRLWRCVRCNRVFSTSFGEVAKECPISYSYEPCCGHVIEVDEFLPITLKEPK
jgi:hypothetical protein